MEKWIKVRGVKGKLVAVSSGARAYVAQRAVAQQLDPETQQLIPHAEPLDGFEPDTACVISCRHYLKAVRKGQLLLLGGPVAAASASEASDKLKGAKLETAPSRGGSKKHSAPKQDGGDIGGQK